MNPQYSQQLPSPIGSYPSQPNYNGNQIPPNSFANQVHGLSTNPNQQPKASQAGHINKPAVPPITQPQPNIPLTGYGTQGNMPQPNQPNYNQPAPGPYNQYSPGLALQPEPPKQRPNSVPGQPITNELGLPTNAGISSESKMNSQYTQQKSPSLQPIGNFPPQQNYNGNQLPSNTVSNTHVAGLSLSNFPPQPSFNGNQLQQNNLPNQMAGLSLNNIIPNQPSSVTPQAGYPNKQMMPPMTQPHPQVNYPQSGYGPQGSMPQSNRPVYSQPVPGSYNQYPPGMAAPPPQRRLDPDQMPNPIQVMMENQRSTTGPFVTNEIGAVPPLVTTKFTTHDQGNSGPRYIRSTMYNVPATPDMIKQTSVPFSLIVSPFAETSEGEINPPIVDFGEVGPIRCVRCKAYMSPNMQFVDAGRRFRCPMCKASTDVPSEYFQHLDHAGQRVDKYERPELVLGTYEFVATKEYCRENKPSKPPAFIFVIDVSYNNIKSGLVHLLCREMKTILKYLPIDQGHERSKMKIGFITYNNSVHFYNCKENLAQPQMMVVGDIHEMFMPLLDGFFVDYEESATVIDALMEQIPKMFSETRETETILLPAIQAGLEAIKASECSGKLLVFHSSLPVSDAPGRLQNREDRKVLGTEKEKAILSPQNNTYNNLGQECVLAGCSVDLFIFNNSYVDLATIGQVARLSGGEIYKYTYFQADIDGPRVIADLKKNISRPIAFDAVMRVRTSAGIRPTEFYGHFFMGNTTDLDLGSITSGKSIGIEIKHDDKLPPDDNVYIQVALLFTACSGQRRIRILNLALKTCTQMADLFRCCDLDAMILYIGKQLMTKLLDSTPRAVREALETRCAQILACYRKNCASPTSAGQLILPECMKLLPLYVSCIMKNDAISGGSDMSCDDRSYVMQFIQIMDLPMSVFYFYPRLIPIHDVNPNEIDIPAPIRCTSEKLAEDGAYILENGIHLFIWVGLSLAPEFTQAVFSAPCSQQIDTDRPGLQLLENPLSKRVRGIIDSIQAERPRCMRITIVRSRDKLENILRHYLIEDRSGNGMASYVDYLCHLHKEIRALLS